MIAKVFIFIERHGVLKTEVDNATATRSGNLSKRSI
jgi:hypothetical protein